MKTGLVPTNCTLYAEASLVISFSASAARVSASCRSAASRSISNGHSYGYDSTSMRSCRSTAAHSPGRSIVVDALGADDVATRDRLAEERGCGERARSRRGPPSTSPATRRRRRRTRATSGRGTTRDQLGAPFTTRNRSRSDRTRDTHAGREAARGQTSASASATSSASASGTSGPVPPRPARGASSRTPRGSDASTS